MTARLDPRLGWVLLAVLAVGAARAQQDPSSEEPATPQEPPPGMLLIPAGTTWLGDDEGDPNEGPFRQADVHAFFIDRTEVTCDAYAKFVAETNRPAPGAGVDWAGKWAWIDGKPRPGTGGNAVFLVTWTDADDYCRWAGHRLPTELEWERAARGDDRRRWAWGDEWAEPETRGNWFDGDGHPDGHDHVAPADAYASGASPLGVLQMTGNLWEWVADPYSEEPVGGAQRLTIDADPQYRVVRGGSWYTNNWYWMRVSFRYFLPPDEVSTIYGFRCAADAE